MESRIRTEKANEMALFELLKIREEIDSLVESLDILEDEETLESVRKGMKNIKEGDFISLEELIEKYGLQNEMNLFFQKRQKRLEKVNLLYQKTF